MTDHLPVYRNICNQPAAFDRSLRHHAGDGRNDLQRASFALKQARQIVIVAIGASYSAAIPFVYRLAEAGQRVILEDAAEFLHYTHRAYGDGVVYLLISRSGETIEITRVLAMLQEQGRVTVGLTNVVDSQLARGADLTILMDSPPDEIISIQTYLTTVLALHLLGELVVGEPAQGALFAETAALATPLQHTVDTYRQLSSTWGENFQPWQAIYLLSRGASLATATQGALLLHEMARFPGSAAYSAGHFRHGPWEVADERIRSFIIAATDNTYELNIALARDLARLGCATTLITARPPQDAPAGLIIWEIPATNPRVAPLLQIVPLLFFVYEFARRQSLTPGQFRASTPITLTEGDD